MALNFDINKDDYLVFSAPSVKNLIRQRLNQNGIFTDQNYEGSNLAVLNDVMATVINLLLFYLNQTATNGQWTETQLHSAINKMSKQLGYNPIGYQSSTLSFEVSAQNIDAGIYTIPRYSYVNVGGVNYTFNEDITFIRKKTDIELLEDFSIVKLMFQGTWQQYPLKKASGSENELVFLTVGTNTLIDHFNIDVYVRDRLTQVWSKFRRTTALFLEDCQANVFEARYNSQGKYEIKFGDGIHGKKLSEGDDIAIYYLQSDGSDGEVAANSLNNAKLINYSTSQFETIFSDTFDGKSTLILQKNALIFENQCASTTVNLPETVDEIRENAPKVFRRQNRLVTASDFESYVNSNFKNFIHDIKVINNSEFLNTYYKYFYDIGVADPRLTPRALFNQVNFADSCNFNNVYIFAVPKNFDSSVLNYLTSAQKELIINRIRQEKILTTEVIVHDPIYFAFDIGVPNAGIATFVDGEVSQLVLKKSSNNLRNSSAIINDAVSVLETAFSRDNNILDGEVNISDLTTQILAIDGVSKVSTKNLVTGATVNGLGMIKWNPQFTGDGIDRSLDVEFITSNINLRAFGFPYLANSSTLRDRIVIDDAESNITGVEF